MSNDKINRMRSLKDLSGLVSPTYQLEHPLETKLVQIEPAFSISVEVIDRVMFNPCKFVTKGFIADNAELSLDFYKYEPTDDQNHIKTSPVIARLTDLSVFTVNQLALRIAQIVGFITNRNVVVKNAALVVATYFTVAAYDRFLTAYVPSADDTENTVSLAEYLLLNSFYSVNKETKFPLELDDDTDNVQADFWLHVINATTDLLANSPYDFTSDDAMERTQITRDPNVRKEMHYEAQLRFRFSDAFQRKLIQNSVFNSPLEILKGNFEFAQLLESYPEFNLTPIEGEQEGDFFMTMSDKLDLAMADDIEEEIETNIVVEEPEEDDSSDDSSDTDIEVEEPEEENDEDASVVEVEGDESEQEEALVEIENMVFDNTNSNTKNEGTEEETTGEYALDPLVDRVADLTSELSTLREEQLVNSILRLVGSISGFHTPNVADATAVISENGILRAMINDVLAVADITLSKSVFSIGDGPVKVGSRMVNFHGRDFYKLADLKIGMQRLIEMVISFKNSESESKRISNDLDRANSQVSSLNSELLDLRSKLGELAKELEVANKFRAVPSKAMQGVCIRFKVTFPKTENVKEFYLTAETIAEDGKIKTKDYRRTENINEALFFETKMDARDAILHILKNEKHLDFKATKIKAAYLQPNNVEYVMMMERLV